MTNIQDFREDFTSNIRQYRMKSEDSITVLIDNEHRKKVFELISKDTVTFYALKVELGINLYDKKYYHSSEIKDLYPDYFLLSLECEDRIEEFRKLVYETIDYFYDNRVEIEKGEEYDY